MDPGSTKPSWRSGNTHGFCVTGGHPPIASEPTPSPRLWAAAPGATLVRLCEHTMRVGDRDTDDDFEKSPYALANWAWGSHVACRNVGLVEPLTRHSY